MLIVGQDASATEARPAAYDAWGQHHEDHGEGGSRWKGKGKAIAQATNDIMSPIKTLPDTLTVDWTKYEPPEGLKHAGDIDSEMIRQIIEQSIDRVRARIAEEEEARKAAAEAKEMRQEEATSEEDAEGSASKGKGIDSIEDGESVQANVPDVPLDSVRDASITDDITTTSFPAELPKRPVKSLLRFFRKYNNGPENGESSTASAAHTQDEFRTHSAMKSLVSELINRAREPEVADV
ncbi:hypothetical protein NPX13_g941 [Xylaria arbuscula]|uniref:Uncharacterized protein n=1 Tax=Xylaria arbuscula TaxID=114810 RepID=A0A9W8NMZ7_9PEZI|nr:hypothetical protein NPX13_g941 [Xylaria arbuscula]